MGSGKNRLKHFENMQGKTKIKKAGGGRKRNSLRKKLPRNGKRKRNRGNRPEIRKKGLICN